MVNSPRLRRLQSDHRAMQQLAADSGILDFQVPGPTFGGSPDVYRVFFRGLGLWKPADQAQVLLCDRHEVMIRLGAGYPRSMPEVTWRSPVFHPNISANGVVCLGGYSTHWVPSLQLDELCVMLWDIIRYENFDPGSPYNREAARWVREQNEYELPVDSRPLCDRRATDTVTETAPIEAGQIALVEDIVIEADVVESHVPNDQPEIVFID